MSREKTLAKNTLIYIIGNLTSKVLSFVLLPLYTHYIATAEMGYYDAVFATASIIVPVITLQIYDSMYRYLLDAKSDEEAKSAISNALFVVAAGLCIFTVGYMIYVQFRPFKSQYLILFYIITNVLFSVYQSIARGLKKNVVYALSGVIFTAVTLVLNIILIMFVGMKVDALFISAIAASLTAIAFVEIRAGVIGHILPKAVSSKAIKELIKYSVPLIPNAINWWIISTCSRYIIIYYLGLEANGIYGGVATKFPALLGVVNNVFYLAWQESAIAEYDSDDKDEFYTKMFHYYMKFQYCVLILLLPATKWVMAIMGESYREAWIYIPFLYAGTLFQSFSTFYGTGYLSSKETRGAFTTSIAGSIINLVVSFFLIPVIGLQAASLANMLSFLGMWLLRIRQTRKYFVIRLNLRDLISLTVICAAYMALYYIRNLPLEILLSVLAIGVCLYYNKELIQKLFSFVKHRVSSGKQPQ